MGVDPKKKRPALPAPTESESIVSAAPTEVATEVSRPADENSSYSLPEDGTPVTFKTRGHSANRSQTSLLIEYFEGGKSPGADSPENRKPSVRVRLKPSGSRKDDRITISKPKSSSSQPRRASLARRSAAPQKSSAATHDGDAAGSTLSGSGADGEDSRSINSYASATEESNVSRNIVVEIERSSHRHRPRRPTSPLIPTVAVSRSEPSYLAGAQSEISAIPADSFLDGSKSPRSSSPVRDLAAAAVAATAATAAGAAALQRHRVPSSSRSEDKDRVRSSASSTKNKDKDRDLERDSRRHKSSRSRTSSIGIAEREEAGSPSHRRSSRHRHHNDSTVSGPDNSVLTSVLSSSHRSYDQYSVRSSTSKASSINNPKLLETVEDAIRRLILPQLTALKEEQQQLRGYKAVRASSTSSLPQDDNDRRRSGASDRTRASHRDSRDREGRHAVDDSPSPAPRDDYDSGHEAGPTSRSINSTPQRSTDKLKAVVAGAAGAGLVGLAAAAIADHDKSPTVSRDQRRRLRAEARSRGVEDSQQLPVNQPRQQEQGPPGLYLSEAYSATSRSSVDPAEEPKSTVFRSSQAKQYLEPDDSMLRPPMPLMSEINSDVTRTSILSAESDRPRSASEELREITIHEKRPQDLTGPDSDGAGSRGVVDLDVQTPVGTLQGLGTQHANISHGDLRALPRKAVPSSSIYPSGDGQHEDVTHLGQQRGFEEHQQLQQYTEPEAEDEYDEEYDSIPGYGGPTYDSYGNQIVPAPLNYVPYQPEHRGLSPIPSVSGYTEGGASEVQGYRDSGLTAASISSPGKSPNLDQKAIPSPNSVLSNVKSREFDSGDLSAQSSDVDYRPTATQLTDDGSMVNPNSIRAFEGAAANPNFVHTPVAVESAVASLVDGSMLDGSALTGDSSRTGDYPPTYDPRRSMDMDDRLEEEEEQQAYERASTNARSVESHQSQRSRQQSLGRDEGSRDIHDMDETREVSASSPTTTRTNPSEFAGEFEIDAYGRKVRRPSPTASQTAAITAGAIGLAIQAARDRSQQPYQNEQLHDDAEAPTVGEWAPAGVQRNKSFKERAMDGRLPANTQSNSTDRLDEYDLPRLGASGLPDLVDPLPEIGYGYQEDDLRTNPSVVNEQSVLSEQENWRAGDRTPTQEAHVQHDRGLGLAANTTADTSVAAAAGAAAATVALAASSQHTRQISQDRDDEWQRSSDERKRDTLITNPYEGTSPIVNETLIKTSLSKPISGTAPSTSATATAAATAAAAAAAAAFGTTPAEYSPGSPLGGRYDEGYISQGPGKSPDVVGVSKGKGIDFTDAAPAVYGAEENPFYAPNQTRHFSGLSQGMASPLYDAATGAGIDRIENKDVVALMQHLMVRDAQRSARDTEILVTLVRAASEIRSSFEDVRTMLAVLEKGINNEFSKKMADSEDAIITEILEGTEKTVQMHMKGARQPPPASGARSLYATVSQPDTDDTPAKRQNFFRRALKLLDAKGNNDLSRIEDMLNQLLTQVDVLKAQSAEGAGPGGASAAASTHGPSPYDGMIDAQLPYEHDRGYEPEGHAGTSTTSHASQSQSGFLSVNSRAGPTPQSRIGGGYERKFSDNRISTVPEGNEDDLDFAHTQGSAGMGAGSTGVSGGNALFDNPTSPPLMSSALLATPPPQQARAPQGYEQQEQQHRDFLQQAEQQQMQNQQQQQQTPQSNENTPRTDKAKKHKSSSSSSWFPKISRWSETTTSSVGRVFRSSRDSKKDHDELGFHSGPSRSRSDLVSYDGYEHDVSDKLHTGFSEIDLREDAYVGSPAQQQQQQQQQREQQRQAEEIQRARQYDEDLYGYQRPHMDSTEILPPHPKTFMTPEDPKYRAHRDSLNLQHPQPRSGQPFKAALESRAEHFDSSMSPRSADWAGSATSLRRFPEPSTNRYSDGSTTNAARSGAQQQQQQHWGQGAASSTPTQAKPPRPPKEALDEQDLRQQHTPPRPARLSKAMKTSPLPYHSVESGYGTATQAATSYTGSPRLENRNLSGALTVPTRRPSGPRAMTPKSDRSMQSYNEEGPGSDSRRRKRDTFGTIASQDSDAN